MAQQLTGLHAKFTGDSTSFVRATKLAQLEANKLDAQLRKSKREQDALAASGAGLAKEYHRLRMETDNAYASQVRFEKAAKLVRQTADAQKWSTEQLNAELTRLAGHYQVAEAAGLSMNEQVRAGRFHTANLAAQFNDIGVMLAAGQSPFMLAVQQGTQITQVLQDMGGGARQTFSALGAAFMSLVSPVSLLTIGLIAGGAALIQWGMSALGAAGNSRTFQDALGDAESALTRLNELGKATSADGLTQLQEKYGEVNAELALFISRMREAEEARALQALNEAVGNLADEFGSAFAAITGPMEDMDLISQMLQEDFGLTVEQVRLLEQAFQEAAAATSFEQQQVALAKVRELLAQSSMRGSELYYNVLQAEDAMRQLVAATPGAGWLSGAIDGAKELASSFWEAARAKAAATGEAAPSGPGMTTGGTDWMKGQTGFTLPGAELLPPTSAFAAGGAGGGGRAAANPIMAQLEQLQQSLLTQEQLEMESFARRQETLNQALEQRLISQEEYARLMEQVEATHQFAMLREQNKGVSQTLSALGNLFQGSKKIGAAVALANSWMAFTEVLKDPSFVGRPWARFSAAASALASGMNAVRNIKAAQPGSAAGGAAGAGGGAAAASAPAAAPQTSNISLQLVGGDLFSRDQVIRLINSINEATADGARIILR